MKSYRARPVGWRLESFRHYLASKRIKTSRVVKKRDKYFAPEPEFISVGGRTYAHVPGGKYKDVNEVLSSLEHQNQTPAERSEELRDEYRMLGSIGVVDPFTEDVMRGTTYDKRYFAKKKDEWDFQVDDREKMKWLDGVKDGKVSERDYIVGNLKRHEKGGWLAFKDAVIEQTKHPFKDMDGDWERYTALVDNDVYGPAGKPAELSNDPIERAEERGAATVAKILTQANVEPLIDHGKDSTVRDLTVDLVFGRVDTPAQERRLRKAEAYYAKERSWRLKSKKGDVVAKGFKSPADALKHPSASSPYVDLEEEK